MSKRTKIWLAVAAILVAVGLITFASVMAVNHWDFKKLNTGIYETNRYEIREGFSNITINVDTAEIQFAASDDEICRVDCYEPEKIKHSVDVQDNTLIINTVDCREWYEHIGINFNTPEITVYLPSVEYTSLSIKESTGDIEIPTEFRFEDVEITSSTSNVRFFATALELIKITTSTGDIRVENTSVGGLDLSVSTGTITVSDVSCDSNIRVNVSTGETSMTDTTCKNILSGGSTGNISLKNVNVTEQISIERSTGDVKFDGSDAAEIFVKTDTGDVTGTVLSEKEFIAETYTGRINVPNTTGGKCKITTYAGDIVINIENNTI